MLGWTDDPVHSERLEKVSWATAIGQANYLVCAAPCTSATERECMVRAHTAEPPSP